MGQWSLDDIQWDRFDRSKVDPELMKVIKAASLVERNARDYASYLRSVFRDDPEVHDAIGEWAAEEVQHGMALGRWAQMADPTFDFDGAFELFAAEIKLPLQAAESVRGSRTGEWVARCVVETGTSSMYTALAQAATEPVLKEICRNIAADEFRHYKLFYTHLKRYLARERVSLWGRLRVAWGRAAESEDDELAYAYYAANHRDDGPYDRQTYVERYARRTYRYYQYGHMERALAMIFKAVGLKPHGWLNRTGAALAIRFMRWRIRRFEARELKAAAV
ncbi:MAG: ferritin-like domain-containing protein [Rhodospirillaceae bacterium]|nr:ferritin-like domain-containing protein [Rhodospirillaceae bacterium]